MQRGRSQRRCRLSSVSHAARVALVLVFVLGLGAEAPNALPASRTLDVHVRFFCDPSPIGICNRASWQTLDDVKQDYRSFVFPVLNQTFMRSRVSFRLYDITLDTTHPEFAAFLRPSKNPLESAALNEIAAAPANRTRLTLFGLPNSEIGFSSVAPGIVHRCQGGASHNLPCDPNVPNACPAPEPATCSPPDCTACSCRPTSRAIRC